MPQHTKRDPNQLKLMMTGVEWQATPTDSVDIAGSEDMQDLWDYKLDEAMESPNSGGHGAGLHQSLLERGYDPSQHGEWDKPTLYVSDKFVRDEEKGGWKRTNEPEFRQGEGHHRIAAAAHIERTTGKSIWIPTNYR